MNRRVVMMAVGFCLGVFLWPEPKPSISAQPSGGGLEKKPEALHSNQVQKIQTNSPDKMPSPPPESPDYEALMAKMSLVRLRTEISKRGEKMFQRFRAQFGPIEDENFETWMKDAEAMALANVDYPAKASFDYEIKGEKKRILFVRHLDAEARVSSPPDSLKIMACSQSIRGTWQTLDKKTLEVTDYYEQDVSTCGFVYESFGVPWAEGWIPEGTDEPYGHFFAMEMKVGYGEGGFSILADEDSEPIRGTLRWERLPASSED